MKNKIRTNLSFARANTAALSTFLVNMSDVSSLLFFLFFPFLLSAQIGKQVKIIDREGIYAYRPFDDAYTDRFDLKDSLIAQLGAWGANQVLNNAMEDARPTVWKTDWERTRERLGEYKVYVEFYYKHYIVLNVNYGANQDLDPELRPFSRDFYLIAEKSSVSYDLNQPMKPIDKPENYAVNAAVIFSKFGKNRAFIKDGLEYYPDYDLGNNKELSGFLSSQLSSEQISLLKTLSKESNWGAGTATRENKEKFQQYIAYLVTEFVDNPANGQDYGDELVLLFVPKEENLTNVPDEIQPSTFAGIFMIFKRDAVNYEGKTANLKRWQEQTYDQPSAKPKPAATAAPKTQKDYTTPFNKAIDDFPNQFTHIKGQFIAEDIFGTKKNACTLSLLESDSVFIKQNTLHGVYLEIEYPFMTNTEAAGESYKNILEWIKNTPLNCGKLKVQFEENDDKILTQTTCFVPEKEKGPHANMEIILRKTPSISRVNGTLANGFYVTLSIRKK